MQDCDPDVLYKNFTLHSVSRQGPISASLYYLFQGSLPGVVDVYDGHVAQQPVRERLSARVRGRVTRTHELNALQVNPWVIWTITICIYSKGFAKQNAYLDSKNVLKV